MADVNENAAALSMLSTRVGAMEKDLERNSKQHKEFYDSFKTLEIKESKRESKIDQMYEMMQDVKKDVAIIKDKPTRRWETITNEAVKWGTLLVLAMLAAQMGLTG